MSVQPFRARNVVFGLEKLFFDFDSKTDPPDLDKAWSDVIAFVEHLKNTANIEPLIIQTYRGYHGYAFLWQVVEISSDQQAVAKDIYTGLQSRLLNGRSYATLDSSVLGDIKRMSRVPYSLHEKGIICTPINLNQHPMALDNLDYYREHGLGEVLFRQVVEEVQRKKTAKEILEIFDSFKPRPKVPSRRKWHIRPCFLSALKTGEMPHEMRMALVYEAYCAGMDRAQIVDLYRFFHDFNEEKTRYQVNWLLDRKKEIKPYRCIKIQEKGWCLGEACPMFKR